FNEPIRSPDTHSLTKTGAVLGTPSYMSPEQAQSTESVTTAADIYAIGAIMYELLTGRPPHKGATAFETVMSVRNSTPPTPRKLNPQVDSELELVCLKCIERNPENRYSSAAALASDLENWLAGGAISVRNPSFSAAAAQWMKQNRKFAYSVFAMLIGVVLIVPAATIIFGDDSSSGKVYEHFPAAEQPWFMAIESLPHWAPEISMVSLFLLIWPSLGLWNAIVTRPKSIRHAASLGGLTSLVCAGIIVAAMGWLVVVLMTADYSTTHVRVLGEALWMKKRATPAATQIAATELFEGLDAVPEEIRAKVLADRVFSDQIARGPRSLLMIGFMSWVIALPIFYGTVIAYILQCRNLRFWLLLPRYALAWLSVTIVVALASAYAFGAIIGKMQTDNLKYHVVMIAVAGLIFFLAMRRWRRTAVPTAQLDSQPATPASV
ncbi:MAG: serine/threonine protein kinase, partial [Planctomycetales bacterium]